MRAKDRELAWKTTRPLNESTAWTRTDSARQKPRTIEILQRDDHALFGDPNVYVTPCARVRWATVEPARSPKRKRRKDEAEQDQQASRAIVRGCRQNIVYVPLPGH